MTNTSSGTDDELDAVSDVTNGKQITKPVGTVESDIISALVPECGVPIPSVMANVGETATAQRTATQRVRSRKGGMLIPWHSTRSIQNYHNSGRRDKKKGASGNNKLYSSRGRDGSTASMFSIGSVHSFRG